MADDTDEERAENDDDATGAVIDHTAAQQAKKLVDLYHEHAPSLPKLLRLTDKLRRHVKARFKTDGYTLEQFATAFGKAETSDFLAGRTERWGGASFDWFVKNADNVRKVLEGQYDNRGAGSPRKGASPEPTIEQPPTEFHAAMEVLLNRHDYVTWVRDMVVVNDAGDRVIVSAPSADVAAWVKKFYGEQVAEAGVRAFGRPVDIIGPMTTGAKLAGGAR